MGERPSHVQRGPTGGAAPGAARPFASRGDRSDGAVGGAVEPTAPGPRAAGEGGFALLGVLAVMALTTLTIAALLGLLLTTIRVTEQQELRAREMRAADGAARATINHLWLEGGADDPCEPAVPSEGFRVEFDRLEGDADVTVRCQGVVDGFGDPAGDLRVVGDSYRGTLDGWQTSGVWSSVPGGPPSLGSGGLSLVHSGGEPLEVVGNVDVAAGAAVIRDDAAQSPGMSVRGRYRQGAPGLGGSGTDCGLLAVEGPTWIDTVSGLECGAAVPDAEPASLGLAPTPRSVSGTCPGGSVVTLEPGLYDQDSVATLNRWFGPDECTDTTFHFPDGVYWFDANDPSAGADRHVLSFSDPTSRFVFGPADGWDPATGATAADFPRACRPGTGPDAAGASIVITGRTELRHLAGRLAVCPGTSADGTPLPAVLQEGTVPNDVRVVSATSSDWADVANIVDPGTSTAPVYFQCTFDFLGTTCERTRSIDVEVASDSSSPVDHLAVRVAGEETAQPNSLVSERSGRVEMTLADGATCSSGRQPGIPDGGQYVRYDLLADIAGNTCRGVLLGADGSQLDGATARIEFTIKYASLPCLSGSGCPLGTAVAQQLQLSGVDLELDVPLGGDSTTRGFTTPCGEAICGEEPVFTHAQTMALGTAGSDPDHADDVVRTVSIALTQGSLAQPGQLDFRIRPTLPGQVDFTLTLADGTECTATRSGVPNSPGTREFTVLDIEAGAVCSGGPVGELTVADLDGATATMTSTLECLSPRGAVCGSNDLAALAPSYLRPAPIVASSIVVTGDRAAGDVTRAVLTVDAPDTGDGASANFFGPGHLPNSNVDVRWDGEASGASLFGGSLQVFSLGSRMADGAEADPVCCVDPQSASRTVTVTSYLGGDPAACGDPDDEACPQPRLAVTAAIPSREAGRPEVLDWEECGPEAGCAPWSPGDPDTP